jgi:hypothetical protein
MESPPTSQEQFRLLRPQVESLALQRFVRRQDNDEREGDVEQEKQSTDKPSPTPVHPPRYESRKRADQRERNLHQCASFVAWPPFRHRQLTATRKSCWLLNQVDVKRDTGKDARSERRNYL